VRPHANRVSSTPRAPFFRCPCTPPRYLTIHSPPPPHTHPMPYKAMGHTRASLCDRPCLSPAPPPPPKGASPRSRRGLLSPPLPTWYFVLRLVSPLFCSVRFYSRCHWWCPPSLYPILHIQFTVCIPQERCIAHKRGTQERWGGGSRGQGWSRDRSAFAHRVSGRGRGVEGGKGVGGVRTNRSPRKLTSRRGRRLPGSSGHAFERDARW